MRYFQFPQFHLFFYFTAVKHVFSILTSLLPDYFLFIFRSISIINYNWHVQNDRKYKINRKFFFSIITDLFPSCGMKIILFIFIPLNENKYLVYRKNLNILYIVGKPKMTINNILIFIMLCFIWNRNLQLTVLLYLYQI